MWRRRSLVIAAAAALSVSLFQPSVSADDAVGGAGAVEKQSVVAAASEPAESAPYEIPEYNPVPLSKGEEPPATPEPEDYADLRATGLRLMLEDLRNGDLKEEAFINHAYAKLGYQSKGVPARYRDDALTEGEQIILGMAIGREIEKLPHPVRKSIQNRLAHAKDLQRFLKEDPKDDLTDESTDESAVDQSASAQESSGDVSVLAAPVECGVSCLRGSEGRSSSTVPTRWTTSSSSTTSRVRGAWTRTTMRWARTSAGETSRRTGCPTTSTGWTVRSGWR